MKLRHVKFFGARYALNLIIDWVNGHEVQSQETLVAREKTRGYLQDHEDAIGKLIDQIEALQDNEQDNADNIRNLYDRVEQLEPKDEPEDPNMMGRG